TGISKRRCKLVRRIVGKAPSKLVREKLGMVIGGPHRWRGRDQESVPSVLEFPKQSCFYRQPFRDTPAIVHSGLACTNSDQPFFLARGIMEGLSPSGAMTEPNPRQETCHHVDITREQSPPRTV